VIRKYINSDDPKISKSVALSAVFNMVFLHPDSGVSFSLTWMIESNTSFGSLQRMKNHID